MMLFLTRDIFDDDREMRAAETEDAVAFLPAEMRQKFVRGKL